MKNPSITTLTKLLGATLVLSLLVLLLVSLAQQLEMSCTLAQKRLGARCHAACELLVDLVDALFRSLGLVYF